MPNAHPKLNALTAAVAVAAAAALLAAAASASAQAQEQTCAGPPSWTTVLDEQGLPSLQQTQGTRCTSSLDCASTNDTVTASPYQGWVTITDDTGVGWLYPASLAAGTRQLACTSQAAAPDTSPSPATTATVAATPAVAASPYPGWELVTDDNGLTWLYPASHTH